MKLDGLSKSTGPANIPVRVASYDQSDPDRAVVVGERVDTGESVRVYLEPDTVVRDAKKKRPEIADFAGKSRMTTKQGGIIRFDGARPSAVDGETTVYGARWATALQPDPAVGVVAIAHARALPPVSFSGRDRQAIEMVYPDEARVANSADELLARLREAFGGEAAGTPGAFLRIEGTKGGKPTTLVRKVQATFSIGADQQISRDSPEVAVDKFKKTPFGAALLKSLNGDGAGTAVEVIPSDTVNLGGGALQRLGGTARSIEKQYALREPDKVPVDDFPSSKAHGFALSTIAIEWAPDNGPAYATEVQRLQGKLVPAALLATPLRGDLAAAELGEEADGELLFDAEEVSADTGPVIDGPAQRLEPRPGVDAATSVSNVAPLSQRPTATAPQPASPAADLDAATDAPPPVATRRIGRRGP